MGKDLRWRDSDGRGGEDGRGSCRGLGVIFFRFFIVWILWVGSWVGE